MATRIAVVGAGTWGTTMAALLADSVPTVLWARRAELALAVSTDHRNPDYLPDAHLPRRLTATAGLEEALAGASVVVMAVPSHGFRGILERARPFLAAGTPIVSLAKGLEEGTLKRMTQVIAEVAPACPPGVLTGPNVAGEIMAGQPAATVIAMHDEALAVELQYLFATDLLRVYTNTDVVGCEVAGALKNVIAIASGMGDGLGFGDNTRAALITRGLAELSRLGTALGGDPFTFAGLAGMGDLVVTCISRRSRNRHVGEQVARGRSMAEVVDEMKMVAEGVKTSRAVLELGAGVDVEVPISEQVVAVLYEGKRASDAIPTLMLRQAKPEHHARRVR